MDPGGTIIGMATDEREGVLEREAELERIADLLASAASGRGASLAVQGPAGVGKSTLLAAAADLALDGELDVAAATGHEIERGFAFGVAIQLLTPLIEELSDAEQDELFSGAAGLARPLFAGEIVPGAGETFPRIHGLHWLCANLAERRPLLLVVDDAQWADGPSLAFLSYLVPRLSGLPLCLALGIRTGETVEGTALEATLAREGGEILAPRPLSEAAVGMLVREQLGDEGPELASECSRLTGGNPLFLRELVRAIGERDMIDAGQIGELATEGVGRIVVGRTERLSEADRRLVRLISVLDDGADPYLVSRLVEIEPEDLAEAIDKLVAVGLLDGDRPLSFEHPIVRRAVYESIPPGTRSRIHLDAARALVEVPATAERAAAHLLECDVAVGPAGEQVVDALRLAARRAGQAGAGEQSRSFLGRALAEQLTPEVRRGVLVELGTEELRMGIPEAMEHLAEAHQLSAPGSERAAVAVALSAAQAQNGALAEASETCDRALAQVEADDLRLALEAQRANSRWLGGMMEESERARLRALEPEVAAGETPGQRAMLTVLAAEAGVSGSLSAARVGTLADNALGDGALLAEVGAEHPSFTSAAAAKTLSDDLDGAADEWTRGVEHSRRRGSLSAYAHALCCRAYTRGLAGDVTGSEADAAEAIDLLPDTYPPMAPMALAAAANVAAERGDLDLDFEERLEELVGSEPSRVAGTVNYAVAASGALALSRGDATSALERFNEAGRRCLQIGWTGPGSIPWRSGAALALVELGRHGEALELADQELELACASGASGPIGIALSAKAIAVGGSAGIELCGEAAAVLADSGARLRSAKAQIQLGTMLRASGADSECRTPLREGMDLAHRCGSTRAVDAALSELRASGARPRRPALRGSAALSPKERETAHLAAGGLGNREIAEAMFLTQRTVEMHLSSVYRKLEIASREQLPEALLPAAAA